MPTVWIVRESEKDSSAAGHYGQINFIFRPGESVLSPAAITKRIREDVLPVSSPNDLVVLMGPSLMIHMLTLMLFDYHGSLRLLNWNHNRRCYQLIDFPA